jgi:putative endonuclease
VHVNAGPPERFLRRIVDGVSASTSSLLLRARSRFSPQRPEHLERGAAGEAVACRHLRRSGYKILYRNFRGRTGGELDVVCRDGDTLVFVEVKTRTRSDFGRPFEAVRPDQQRRISRGALAWLRMLDNPDILFRFDVVEVLIREGRKPRIDLIKDAFQLSAPYVY